MNLDDLSTFKTIDAGDFLGQVDGLPDQVEAAWALGQRLPLPPADQVFQNVVLAGSGPAADGAALAQALATPEAARPVSLWSAYGLPAFAGPETLVICSAVGAQPEVTLSAAEAAFRRGARVLVITPGGALADAHGATLWRFPHTGPEHAALGWSCLLTLAALCRMGIVADRSADVAEAVSALRLQQAALRADSPVFRNPAKRLAGQMMGRMPLVFAAELLAPVARHWKNQINVVAKTTAACDALPEMNFNTLAGTLFPEALMSKYMLLCLHSRHDSPPSRLRAELTRTLYMAGGFNTDTVEAAGQSPLANMLTALHYGDYAAYYLAMSYGVDPTPVPQIDELEAARRTRETSM